jgi:integrase
MANHLNPQVKQIPWNASRIIGSKPPLKPKQVWAIRQRLKDSHRVRDLALFNCAIDSKLRGCDLVALKVSDLAPAGVLRRRATVVQQKTRRPVPFELTEPAREALTAWLERRGDCDND